MHIIKEGGVRAILGVKYCPFFVKYCPLFVYIVGVYIIAYDVCLLYLLRDR